MENKKHIIDSAFDAIAYIIATVSRTFCVHSWHPLYKDPSIKRCVHCFDKRKITEKSTILRIFFCKKDFVAVHKKISDEDVEKSLTKNIPIIKEKVCLCCGTSKYTT